jgi:hypothetical protein
VKFCLSRVLNSVWILVPAVEGKGPPCCNGCVGNVATSVLVGFYFIMWLGSYCLIVCEFENLEGSLCFLAVRRIRSLNSVSAGISKLCLGLAL